MSWCADVRILIAAGVSLSLAVLPAAAAPMRGVNSDHFIVEHEATAADFARQVSLRAEEYYASIADELGYVRYDNFWRWDNRVRIVIYADHDAYQRATGRPAWSHGYADYAQKKICSYVWGDGFLDTLLAHEIAHLIFRDFVGFKGEVPLWLDEGVAQWTHQRRSGEFASQMAQFKSAGISLPLADMMRMDIRGLAAEAQITLPALTGGTARNVSGQTLIGVYYRQAVSLVGFLIQRYGTDRFVQLCRQLRDGRTLAEALPFVYPTQMRTVTDMELQWQEYVEEL